jgi:hypothetical protein
LVLDRLAILGYGIFLAISPYQHEHIHCQLLHLVSLYLFVIIPVFILPTLIILIIQVIYLIQLSFAGVNLDVVEKGFNG